MTITTSQIQTWQLIPDDLTVNFLKIVIDQLGRVVCREQSSSIAIELTFVPP